MQIVTGGVLAPKGYKAGSVAAGIKKKKLDMTVLVSEEPATVAGAYTTNVVKAAPVLWDQDITRADHCVRAVVVNSGNANACTGAQGVQDVQATANHVAQQLNIEQKEVLVCSTGVIGVPLVMDTVLKGASDCLAHLQTGATAATDAATAICTTDTFSKEIAVEIEIDGATIRIGGMAKGSGMIHPNMATMLSFITTDATVEKAYLQKLLGTTVIDSYNMISVDGDTSTNDTVLVLANGTSKAPAVTAGSASEDAFVKAFRYVHTELAKMIVQDGEGAGKFIEVTVKGAQTKEDARIMARSIISSNLVKTAFFGSDANWGRIICAMGYSGATFDPNLVSITFVSEAGMIVVLQAGTPLKFDENLAKKILQENIISVVITVGSGSVEATAWGCDLSYEYVRINGDYRS
ncbi:MAG: bifunctional glutamate N-acetyltransferase/amino-acid acetyltransferase ArgJ [Sphaerochaetaceae bacterium]